MRAKYIIVGIIATVLVFPIVMWLAWLGSPKTKLVIAIVDKTVLDKKGQEHISLTWVLNHQKITKTSRAPYTIQHDYFGFFPLDSSKFRLKGLERFTPEQIKRLSDDADVAYYTDTYGIYYNEWFRQGRDTERSGILYGGMSEKDIDFLESMSAKNKLIITEFNSIGSPTKPEIRTRFEQLFGMRWTGWTARYFDILDSTKNKELPRWLIRNYSRTSKQPWNFTKSGIAFVHFDERVVVLEDSTDLEQALPHIISNQAAQDEFSLPAKIKYPFWFDIIEPDKKINRVISDFKIDVNKSGADLLRKQGIPLAFPAAISRTAPGYRFYYFSGDFCDNPVTMGTSYFKGISYFKWLFYNTSDPTERSSFFWNYYKPLITEILQKENLIKR